MTPYKLEINNINVIAKPDKILIIIRILVISVLEYFFQQKPKNIQDVNGHGSILNILHYILVYVNIITYNLYVILGFLQRHEIQHVLKELLHTDHQLQFPDIKVKYLRDQPTVSYLFCLQVTKLVIVFLWLAMYLQDHYLYLIKYAILIIPSSSMHLHFVIILFIIQKRYTILNQHIKCFEKTKQSSMEFFMIFNKWKDIHKTLLSTTRMLLKAFQIQIMIRL